MNETYDVTNNKSDLEKIIDVIHSIKIPDSQITDPLYTIKETCKYLRCSVVSLQKIRKESNLEKTLVGKKIFFKKSVLDEYLGIRKSLLYTRKQLRDKFGINRLRLLQWEIDGKVTGRIVNEEMKYRITEIFAAMKLEKKEVDHA